MPWNSIWPNGSKSVEDNAPTGVENTTYLETIVSTDHFFNKGADEDGHHQFVQMKDSKNAGGDPFDPVIATGMSGVTYQKQLKGTSEKFYKNGANVYQITPNFLSGTVILNKSNYVQVDVVPDETFGYAWIYAFDGTRASQFGYFKAAEGTCHAFNQIGFNETDPSIFETIKFAYGPNSLGLSFKAKAGTSPEGIYSYKIMCWTM